MRNDAIVIERMRSEHLPDVLRIEQASYPDPWSRASFSKALGASPPSLTVVARRDEAVVGYIVAWLVLDEAHIGNVAVAPETRRQGIGRMMMEWLQSHAMEQGCTCSSLEVRDSNTAAKRLYTQLGYLGVGRRNQYYRNPREDAIIMVKTMK